MNQREISEQVDKWIAEEKLKEQFSNIRPLSRFDDLFPQDVYERRAYWDFQKWCFEREHLLIEAIRKNKEDRFEKDFWEEWRV